MFRMIKNKESPALTYRDAGVDIEKANYLVQEIKHIAARTHRSGVLSDIGGFGALFEIPIDRYQRPVLVSGTDGVGTKLKLAIAMNHHDTIGIDLVAMCVNDVITSGAEPLFFLDYYAMGKLNLEQSRAILQGIGKGCEMASIALMGGETAEMPSIYSNNEYDLAGFCVGIVEKNQIITGNKVKPGDMLIGIASSGFHSNGYSLIRHIIAQNQLPLDSLFENTTFGDILLTPTRIYVKSILTLIKAVEVHALVHITGGGMIENIPRVLPNYTKAVINASKWQWPPIFYWLQKKGQVTLEEMYRTFNLGIGMVVIVKEATVDNALAKLKQTGEQAWVIGCIEAETNETPAIKIISQ